MENLLDFHYERLEKDGSRPGNVITSFYGDLFDKKPGRKEVIMFNSLIKVYGRYIVFFAVLDLTNVKKLDHDNLYGLLHSICRNRFERSHPRSTLQSSIKLNTTSLKKLGDKIKKQTIIIPEMEERLDE